MPKRTHPERSPAADPAPSAKPPARLDPSRCPLCDGDNRCAMEIEKTTGQAQPPCWCVGLPVSAERLASLPAAMQGRACLCGTCLLHFFKGPDGA